MTAITPGQYGGITLDAEQCGNVETIWEVCGEVGIQPRDQAFVIAVATASVESGIRNLDYGDKDSLGMFQQRAPWGSAEQRLDPIQATRMFLLGGDASDGYSEPGLMSIPGWPQMPPGGAAQAVQRSAYPDRYAERVPMAQALLVQLQGGSVPKFPTNVTDPPFIGAPNSGGTYKKVLLVVHVTVSPEVEGGARGVIADWNRTQKGSTQFVVDDKEIIQAVREQAYAWAAGTTANKWGIHVEHCGFIQTVRQWRDGYSTAELELSAPLFAYEAQKYGIPIRRLTVDQIRHAVATGNPADGGICGHADITKAFPGETTHTDPGTFFPWDRFMGLIQDAADGKPTPPKDWFDMATQDDLKAVINGLIPDIASAVAAELEVQAPDAETNTYKQKDGSPAQVSVPSTLRRIWNRLIATETQLQEAIAQGKSAGE